MPKTKISEYSATANSNTDVASVNIDEGCAPSGINNAIRAVMGHLKDFQAGTSGDAFNGATNGAHNGSVGATTPAAGTFTTLSATGNVTLGDAAADTVTVNGTTNFAVAPTIGGVGINGFKNRIINGAMMIDQRNAGASVSGDTNIFGPDRFRAASTQNSKFTMQQNAGSVTPPAGFKNYLGITSSSAYSVLAGDYFLVGQPVEGFNTSDLGFGAAGASTVTLSFWVRSSLTGTFGGSINNSAYNRSYPFSYTISAANTWEQKSVTIAGDTTGTWIGATNGTGLYAWFNLGTGSTGSTTANAWAAGAYYAPTGATRVVGTNGATFYITGVQLEKGTTNTSFDYLPYGTELALCQRYFISYGGSASYERFGTCICNGTTGASALFTFPVEMRTVPTFSYSSLANLAIYTGTAVLTVTAVGGDSPAPKTGMIALTVASGLAANATYQVLANNTTSARATWSAEL